VVASNRAARSLFSNVEDPIGARRLTELTRNPAIYDAFLDGIRGKERAGVKVETYGGERRVFDLRVVPLQSANGKASHGAVGVFFDITRLERLELIRQEFLSNVSHELRTPLTSIIALADTLEAGAINDSEHNRRFVSIIQKNAARMHRLIDDILALSEVEESAEGSQAHHLDGLCERFYRVARARSRERGGTGLGLAIVKHLARAHGGEVTVESRFGEGTQFSIELPRRTTDATEHLSAN